MSHEELLGKQNFSKGDDCNSKTIRKEIEKCITSKTKHGNFKNNSVSCFLFCSVLFLFLFRFSYLFIYLFLMHFNLFIFHLYI